MEAENPSETLICVYVCMSARRNITVDRNNKIKSPNCLPTHWILSFHNFFKTVQRRSGAGY